MVLGFGLSKIRIYLKLDMAVPYSAMPKKGGLISSRLFYHTEKI